jgi:hypothetical protein
MAAGCCGTDDRAQVFVMALMGNYSYVPVPRGDFSFPGVCGSQTSGMARPLSFGQTADFTSGTDASTQEAD